MVTSRIKNSTCSGDSRSKFLSLAGKYDNFLVNILSKPGLMMQGLTTKEPTEDMVEVAIVAVEEVFDWKKYLRENFSRSDL